MIFYDILLYTKAALHTRRLLVFYFQIFRRENLVVYKLCKRHIETSRKQNYGTESYRFISSIHDTLHTSVLYSRLLLQTVLGHILFLQQLGNTLCNSVIYRQVDTSDKKI